MSQILVPDIPIMLVDDDEPILWLLEHTLRAHGFDNFIAISDSRAVPEILARQEVAFVILDLNMPHIHGESILELIAENWPELPVIVLSADNKVATIVTCMKKGAFDYLPKPFEPARLLSATRCALEAHHLRKERVLMREAYGGKGLANPEAFAEIMTNDQKMLSIFRYAEAVARSPHPVIVTGETGVGKELIARAVHTLSGRPGEFVPVNVAGLDENIFADTLFGHVRGAYTGASHNRSGLIKIARGGTLFLDEIGDLNMASQIKLLRFLQEHEYLPLGADRPESSDARIIAATNQNLEALRDSGVFRKDLYFRLYSHHIHLPPLRERPNDLPLLFDSFLKAAARELCKETPAVNGEIYTLLGRYHFPGNIRELKALVIDAVSKHESGSLLLPLPLDRFRRQGDTSATALQVPETSVQSTQQAGMWLSTLDLKEARRLVVEEALRRANGNNSIAARMLGLKRQSLAHYHQS